MASLAFVAGLSLLTLWQYWVNVDLGDDLFFLQTHPSTTALAVAAGVTVALLLLVVSWSLATTRSRAVALADRMTVELRESQQRFQAVADTALDAIVSADAEGRIVYANKSAETTFGYAAGGLVGQPLTVLMPDRFRRAHQEGFGRFLATGNAKVLGKVVELVGQRRDGSEFPLELSLAHWRESEAHFFTAMLRDVTERKRAEEKFRDLLESAPDAMVIADQDGNIVLINKQTEIMFGYERGELLGQNVELLMPERYRDGHPGHRRGYFDNPKARGMGSGRELFGQRIDGTEFPIEISLSPLQTEDGVWVSSAIRDVTERKCMEQAVYESEHRYRQLVDSSRGLICAHDMNGILRYVNAAAADALGYRVEELVGHKMADFLVTDFEDEFPAYLERIRHNGRDSGLMAVLTKDHDERIWMYDNALCESVRDGEYVLGHAQDVTELRRTQEALKAAHDTVRQMATHDGLTGLCNRQLFYEHLTQAIEYAKRYKQVFAVLFLDLDKFKQINDTLGHSAGDQLLRTAASILTSSVRKSDVEARMGGDEFVVLLRNIENATRAELVARKIAQKLQTPVVIEGERVVVTASIGMACYPADGQDAEELVRNADTAMYHAKHRGRNNIKHYAKGMKPPKKR